MNGSDVRNSQVFLEMKRLVGDSHSSSHAESASSTQEMTVPQARAKNETDVALASAVLESWSYLSVLEYLPTSGLSVKAVITFFPF